MMTPPERSPERDAAIEAVLVRVPVEGWTMAALRGALQDLGSDPLDAELLFPGGVSDLIESYVDLADRRMEGAAESVDMTGQRLPARVRAVIATRLRQSRAEREAVRRALGVLSWPGYAAVAARALARTVDAIWYAAGDRSADFSWYTKRAILGGVYGATLLYWLNDPSDDDADTLAFLDRRLAGVGRIGRARGRLEAAFARMGGRAPSV